MLDSKSPESLNTRKQGGMSASSLTWRYKVIREERGGGKWPITSCGHIVDVCPQFAALTLTLMKMVMMKDERNRKHRA